MQRAPAGSDKGRGRKADGTQTPAPRHRHPSHSYLTLSTGRRRSAETERESMANGLLHLMTPRKPHVCSKSSNRTPAKVEPSTTRIGVLHFGQTTSNSLRQRSIASSHSMLQSENANLLCVRWRQVWYQESTDDLSPSSSSKRYLPYSLTTSSISPRLALQKRQEKKRRLAVLRIPQTPHTISLSWMELLMSAALGSAWS